MGDIYLKEEEAKLLYELVAAISSKTRAPNEADAELCMLHHLGRSTGMLSRHGFISRRNCRGYGGGMEESSGRDLPWHDCVMEKVVETLHRNCSLGTETQIEQKLGCSPQCLHDEAMVDIEKA